MDESSRETAFANPAGRTGRTRRTNTRPNAEAGPGLALWNRAIPVLRRLVRTRRRAADPGAGWGTGSGPKRRRTRGTLWTVRMGTGGTETDAAGFMVGSRAGPA